METYWTQRRKKNNPYLHACYTKQKQSRLIKFFYMSIHHDYAALTRAGDDCGLGHLGAFFGAV